MQIAMNRYSQIAHNPRFGEDKPALTNMGDFEIIDTPDGPKARIVVGLVSKGREWVTCNAGTSIQTTVSRSTGYEPQIEEHDAAGLETLKNDFDQRRERACLDAKGTLARGYRGAIQALAQLQQN